jgi:cell division protein FtsI (penicillin-binding protein 3)
MKRHSRTRTTGRPANRPYHETDSRSRENRRRFIIVFGIIGVAAAAVLIRYGTIMLAPPSENPLGAHSAVERGPILDRNGRILAIQTQLDTVWAWRPDIEDADAVARELAPIIGQDVEQLAGRLGGTAGSVTIKRTISPAESAAIRELQAEGGLVGIRLRQDSGRAYPEQATLGPVLGFVGDDGYGLEGIEYTMEQWLSPRDTAEEYGNQVFLTIDLNIQYESERLARAAMEEHDADSVVILTMDAETGDLLGYAAEPGYDPNQFRQIPEEERRNRPIADVYEPGSVLKVFTIASFLQLGGITMDSTFLADAVYEGTDPPITDLGYYGVLDTTGVIRRSSNVGAATASETVSARDFYNMLRLFGFGEESGIELNGESSGLLAPLDDWSARTKPTIAIGQEIAVTAIQVISGATVFANRGILLKPNIVERVVSPSGRVLRDYGRTPVREVVSAEVAQSILGAMEEAVADDLGTGRRIRYEGLRVAAKTGTAEMVDPETGTYSDVAFLASTLAIVPADNPSVIIYIAIDYPKGPEFYGGRIAAPVVREYLDFLVPYLGIPVEGDNRITQPGQIVVSPIVLPPLGETVPDYRGLPKRALLPLLERDDVTVDIRGYGWVESQQPAPGTPFTEGMTLTLELE